MARWILAIATCALVGVGIELSGVAGTLAMHRLVPPHVPENWAAMPTTQRVDVTLVGAAGLADGLAIGLTSGEVALHRNGAVAFVDGRVFAGNSASARNLLQSLGWAELPIQVRQMSASQLDVVAPPASAPWGWRFHRRAYAALLAGRGVASTYPAGVSASLSLALLLLVMAAMNAMPRRGSAGALDSQEIPFWRRSQARLPARVVLVPDRATLEQLRVAIGEEHVIAACEHAFAFANGWILATRKGSVFELMGALGWSRRPLEMATRAALAAEGHDIAPASDGGDCDALGLLEALHVCGPVAHRNAA